MATRKKIDEAVMDEAVTASSVDNVEVVAQEAVVESVEEQSQATVAPKRQPAKSQPKKTERIFAQDDLIQCKSVTMGRLVYSSKKSGNQYRFEGYGDEREICYGDLYPLLINRSKLLFDPKFVIEDDEVLGSQKWSALKTFYDNMYTKEDVRDILKLPPSQFERALNKMPKGMVDAVKIAATTGLQNGTFDSIKKVEIMDRVLGTDLKVLIL